MFRKFLAVALAIVALLGVAGCSNLSQALPAERESGATEYVAPRNPYGLDNSSAERVELAMRAMGLNPDKVVILATDDARINCGGKGGGCAPKGDPKPVIVISPSAEKSNVVYWRHMIAHEYAHATLNASECEAEAFAIKVTKVTLYGYPSCAKGVEPLPGANY